MQACLTGFNDIDLICFLQDGEEQQKAEMKELVDAGLSIGGTALTRIARFALCIPTIYSPLALDLLAESRTTRSAVLPLVQLLFSSSMRPSSNSKTPDTPNSSKFNVRLMYLIPSSTLSRPGIPVEAQDVEYSYDTIPHVLATRDLTQNQCIIVSDTWHYFDTGRIWISMNQLHLGRILKELGAHVERNCVRGLVFLGERTKK